MGDKCCVFVNHAHPRRSYCKEDFVMMKLEQETPFNVFLDARRDEHIRELYFEVVKKELRVDPVSTGPRFVIAVHQTTGNWLFGVEAIDTICQSQLHSSNDIHPGSVSGYDLFVSIDPHDHKRLVFPAESRLLIMHCTQQQSRLRSQLSPALKTPFSVTSQFLFSHIFPFLEDTELILLRQLGRRYKEKIPEMFNRTRYENQYGTWLNHANKLLGSTETIEILRNGEEDEDDGASTSIKVNIDGTFKTNLHATQNEDEGDDEEGDEEEEEEAEQMSVSPCWYDLSRAAAFAAKVVSLSPNWRCEANFWWAVKSRSEFTVSPLILLEETKPAPKSATSPSPCTCKRFTYTPWYQPGQCAICLSHGIQEGDGSTVVTAEDRVLMNTLCHLIQMEDGQVMYNDESYEAFWQRLRDHQVKRRDKYKSSIDEYFPNMSTLDVGDKMKALFEKAFAKPRIVHGVNTSGEEVSIFFIVGKFGQYVTGVWFPRENDS
eukprot:GILK01002139.1.p1 GENE.GILK01002139.1~~GILK01002139.1.p1  ORF type:complete len:504 (-),score=80.92 GILK01002139.1:164-1630(-)